MAAGRRGRRGFVLGMTLNELAFLLFFLLLLVSVESLQSRNRQIQQKADRLQQVQQQLSQKQQLLDQTFRKLALLQETVDRLYELQPQVRPGELDRHFKRLIASENSAREDNEALKTRLRELQPLAQIPAILAGAGYAGPADESVRKLLQQNRDRQQREQRVARHSGSMDKGFRGSGLDHRPCWVSGQGAIEYLYRITILEKRFRIEPAWPSYRNKATAEFVARKARAVSEVDPSGFRGIAQPVLRWSRLQKPECRHFVRVHDADGTSKQAFKSGLLLIEHYFYKYLQK